MKVTVNVDSVGKTLDNYIEQNLEEKALPSCFGSMIPPIIARRTTFEDKEILYDKEGVSPVEIVSEKMDGIIEGDLDYYRKRHLVITRKSVEKIEEYKTDLAKDYADNLAKCVNCTHQKTCNMLTKNYLKVVNLQETLKLNEALRLRLFSREV